MKICVPVTSKDAFHWSALSFASTSKSICGCLELYTDIEIIYGWFRIEISLEQTCFNDEDSDKPGLIVDKSRESFISKIKKFNFFKIWIKEKFEASGSFHAPAKRQADQYWLYDRIWLTLLPEMDCLEFWNRRFVE